MGAGWIILIDTASDVEPFVVRSSGQRFFQAAKSGLGKNKTPAPNRRPGPYYNANLDLWNSVGHRDNPARSPICLLTLLAFEEL